MLRPSCCHTLLARGPCRQFKDDFILEEPLHYCVCIKLKIIWVGLPREEVSNPVLYLLCGGSIMRPKLVLRELVFVDGLHLMVMEVEGVLLRVGGDHPVLRFPPFY